MTLSDAFHDLDATLTGDEPDYEAEPIPAADESDAIRKLRLLAHLRREQRNVEDVYNAELLRLQDWRGDRLDSIEKRIKWVEHSLAQYHEARLRDDPKAKTIELPTGTLKVRAQQPVYEFSPEFTTWAMSNAPHIVNIPDPKPVVDKTAAKRVLSPTATAIDEPAPAVDANGELVPGVTVTLRGPKHSIETS